MSRIHKDQEVINSRYTIKKYIGEGGMQEVYLVIDKVLNKHVVLKTPKNDSAKKRFTRSAIVSARINHPNIAKTLDYFNVKDREYLIEEFIEGMDLQAGILNNVYLIDPYLTARIFHHLAKGISASHHVKVVHRDIKPSNILVSGGMNLDEIKITDFGIAKLAEEEINEAVEGGEDSISGSKTVVGALPYMSPELIQNPQKVGLSTDIWSLGALMYHVMTGGTPFGIGLKAITKIVSGNLPDFSDTLFSHPQFKKLNEEIAKIIKKCLNIDPEKRPSADEVVRMCENLCYPIAKRYEGRVKSISYNSWGFISTNGPDVFFNLKSVYGRRPKEGDKVYFSAFVGGGADRAHPLVLKKEL